MNSLKRITWVCIALAILIALGATGIILRTNHHLSQELQTKTNAWAQKKASLDEEIASVQAALDGQLTFEKTNIIPALEPDALIAKLAAIPSFTNHYRLYINDEFVSEKSDKELEMEEEKEQTLQDWHNNIRTAYFCYQGLIDKGDKSIPAIRGYLESGQDVLFHIKHWRKYSKDGEEEETPSYNTLIPSDEVNMSIPKVLPETARLGLIGVLNDIHTTASLSLLCEIMTGSDKWQESMYAAKLLMKANAKAFREACIKTCRNMLANLSKESEDYTGWQKRKNRIDILKFLAQTCQDDVTDLLAKVSIYDEDGKPDMAAIREKAEILGEKIVPEVYEAFQKEGLNLMERGTLLGAVMDYIGSNEQANTMYTDMYKSLEGDNVAPVGSMLALSLVGDDMGGFMGGMGDSNENTISKELAQNRIALLDQIQQQYSDSQPLVAESAGITKDFLHQIATTGTKPNEEEFTQKLIESGYIQRFIPEMMKFMKNNEEMLGMGMDD